MDLCETFCFGQNISIQFEQNFPHFIEKKNSPVEPYLHSMQKKSIHDMLCSNEGKIYIKFWERNRDEETFSVQIF